MQTYARLSKRYLSFPGPSFRLTGRSRRRLILLNVLPLIMVTALVLFLVLTFTIARRSEFEIDLSWRAFVISRSLVEFGIPLTIAALVVGALHKWSRAEGSWMFTIGATLAVVAFGLGAVGLLVFATSGQTKWFDWHPDTFLYIARQLAFLSVAYFFVACRATSAKTNNRLTARRARIRRRPRRAGG